MLSEKEDSQSIRNEWKDLNLIRVEHSLLQRKPVGHPLQRRHLGRPINQRNRNGLKRHHEGGKNQRQHYVLSFPAHTRNGETDHRVNHEPQYDDAHRDNH